MNRNAAFGVGALVGAAAAFVWDRRSRLRAVPAARAPEVRQRELREKLAEAQEAEAPPSAPAAEAPKPPAPPPPPAPAPEAKPVPPPPAPAPPPADEFEAMRRRIHEEGKAAAEEMRRPPDTAS